MGVIVVQLQSVGDRKELLYALRDLVGASLHDADEVLTPGAILFQEELFTTDFLEHAECLRELIPSVQETGSAIRIYELSENESLSDYDDPSPYLISPDVLFNIIDDHESRYQGPYT